MSIERLWIQIPSDLDVGGKFAGYPAATVFVDRQCGVEGIKRVGPLKCDHNAAGPVAYFDAETECSND